MNKALFLKQALLVYSVLFTFSVYSCKTRKAAQPAASVADVKPMKGDSVESLLSKVEEYSFKAEWMSAKANVTIIDSSQELPLTSIFACERIV